MPPAIVAAGIGAAGGLGGALIASKGASNAAKSQERSTAEALDFERDREMRRRMEFDQAREDRMKAHEAQERAFEPYRLAAAGVLKKYIPNYDFERMNAPPEIQTAAPPEEDPYTLGMLARGR